MDILCKICRKKPEELQEYVDASSEASIEPNEYVIQEEGTYNARTGYFYCTECYVKLGMPLGTA